MAVIRDLTSEFKRSVPPSDKVDEMMGFLSSFCEEISFKPSTHVGLFMTNKISREVTKSYLESVVPIPFWIFVFVWIGGI